MEDLGRRLQQRGAVNIRHFLRRRQGMCRRSCRDRRRHSEVPAPVPLAPAQAQPP